MLTDPSLFLVTTLPNGSLCTLSDGHAHSIYLAYCHDPCPFLMFFSPHMFMLH